MGNSSTSSRGDLELPFLQLRISEDTTKEDDADYILVFYNPFICLPGDTPTGYSATCISKEKAETSFLAMFRTVKNCKCDKSEEPFIREIRSKIKTFLAEKGDKIPFDSFAEICLSTILWLFESHLKLKVSLFKSIDNAKIYCKLRATTENLKIHADLIDYHL